MKKLVLATALAFAAIPAAAMAEEDVIERMKAIDATLTEEQKAFLGTVMQDLVGAHVCAPVLDDPGIYERARAKAVTDLDEQGLVEPTIEQLEMLLEGHAAAMPEVSPDTCKMVVGG